MMIAEYPSTMNDSISDAKPARILLVEDDPADILMTRKAMERSKFAVALDVVQDGEDALAFLLKEGPHAEAETPDLILLDLNLPKVSGHEVLQRMRAVERLKAIPVVVLTTSEADHDILKTYELGANCFVTKPVGLEAFRRIVLEIETFWLTIVKLPQS